LVVDDEPSVLDVCTRSLRRHGFEVVTASDAHTARILLRAQAVDLLITDIRMPGEDGISLLQTVRETAPNLPLMIITAYPDAASVDAALDLNVRSFVVKPFNVDEFISEVNRSLDLSPAPTPKPADPSLMDTITALIEHLRQQRVSVLEGVVARDPQSGRVVLVPGDPDGALPVEDLLSEYAKGERVYVIVAPQT
jgi:DNA-binding NtrC family response regulator